MHQFLDSTGRPWDLRLSYATLRAIRAATRVDLGDVEQLPRTWAQLRWDDELALRVLWLAIAESAAAQQPPVTEAEWLDAMDGERLEGATKELEKAIEFFTPPGKRSLAREAMAKIEEGLATARAEATELVLAVTTESITNSLAQLGTRPPTSPESSATSTNAGRSATPSEP